MQKTSKDAHTETTLKKEKSIKGLDDCGEVDCDSDLNGLASVFFCRYTTITSQC